MGDSREAVASAAMAAFVVVAGIAQGTWLKQGAAGLAAGMGTIFLYLSASLVRNLILAPKRVRRERAISPGSLAELRITLKTKDTDVMQREAALISTTIDKYIEMRERAIWSTSAQG
jgi:hypothetical protein